MTDVIGRGVIEVSADATKLKAGIEDAKRSIKSLGIASGDATKSQSQSIDRYVKQLGIAAVTTGKTGRELELYKLALRGANAEQLKAADSALRMTEAYARGEKVGEAMRRGLVMVGTAAVTSLIAAAAAFDTLVKKAGDFQDMAEKTGDTAESFASLAVAAGTTNTEMESLVATSIKMNKNLVGVDDEAKAAGAALKALGIDVKRFKELKAGDQFEELAKALDKFQNGPEKGNVLEGLAKGFAKLQPFLKELGAEGGRQFILTQEQIRQADEYADAQMRLRAQISLHAQALATELIPYVMEAASAIRDFMLAGNGAETVTASMRKIAEGLGVIFQTISVLAANIEFVLNGLGRGIGTYLAGVNALAHFDLTKFNYIRDVSRQQSKEAREDLDKFERRIMALGNTSPKSQPTFATTSAGSIAEQANARKQKLRYEGVAKPGKAGGGGVDRSAEQEAKAQLAYDLDQIKKASEAVTDAYANGQRLLDALHQAGLIEDRDYYTKKRAFIVGNELEQEHALEEEIRRLEAEKLIGKDRIDNERKIAEARAKLSKIQVNSATEIEVNSIKETARLKAVEQGFRDAEAAAQEYLDTIRRANARDLQGVGAGTKERERLAGRAQIEDKYSEEMRRLQKSRTNAELQGTFGPDAQKKYDAELDRIRRFQTQALQEFDSYYQQRIAMDQDASYGAQEAFANYISAASETAKMTEELFTNAFKGMEDALVTFITTGKLNFNSLANSIVADIVRIIVKQQISNAMGVAGGAGGSGWTGLLASAASAMFGGGSGVTPTFDSASGWTNVLGGRAAGGPVVAGGLYRVNESGPELLTVGNKQYLMNGPQAGTVTPTGSADRSVSVVNHFSISGPVDSRTQQQIALQAGRAVQRAAARFA